MLKTQFHSCGNAQEVVKEVGRLSGCSNAQFIAIGWLFSVMFLSANQIPSYRVRRETQHSLSIYVIYRLTHDASLNTGQCLNYKTLQARACSHCRCTTRRQADHSSESERVGCSEKGNRMRFRSLLTLKNPVFL